jgi:acyl carrier protein
MSHVMVDDIQRKLTTIFHDVFDDDSIVLSPSLSAQQVPGWDSLAHVRLMLSVERAFGVKFSAAEIAKLGNVGDLIELIQKKAK